MELFGNTTVYKSHVELESVSDAELEGGSGHWLVVVLKQPDGNPWCYVTGNVRGFSSRRRFVSSRGYK